MNNNFGLCYITYFSFYSFIVEDKILQLNYSYPIFGYDANKDQIKSVFENKKSTDKILINSDLSLLVNLYPGDIALYLGQTSNVKIYNKYVHQYYKIYYPYSGKLCWVSSDCIFTKEVDMVII